MRSVGVEGKKVKEATRKTLMLPKAKKSKVKPQLLKKCLDK